MQFIVKRQTVQMMLEVYAFSKNHQRRNILTEAIPLFLQSNQYNSPQSGGSLTSSLGARYSVESVHFTQRIKYELPSLYEWYVLPFSVRKFKMLEAIDATEDPSSLFAGRQRWPHAQWLCLLRSQNLHIRLSTNVVS